MKIFCFFAASAIHNNNSSSFSCQHQDIWFGAVHPRFIRADALRIFFLVFQIVAVGIKGPEF